MRYLTAPSLISIGGAVLVESTLSTPLVEVEDVPGSSDALQLRGFLCTNCVQCV